LIAHSTVASVTGEEAVRRTLARYCQLCDDGRFDEWAGLYTDDATFTVMGQTYSGPAEIQAFIEKGQPPERRGKHLIGQSVIDLDDGTGTAAAVTDYTFIARTPEGGYAITSAGRYHDSFRRADDGSWQFTSREIRFLGS
jgi:3-phenylpropionate/cinnamic acid dioxygenase small subunit